MEGCRLTILRIVGPLSCAHRPAGKVFCFINVKKHDNAA